MSVREIVARLTHVRRELPHVQRLGGSAETALNEAVTLISSVLDGVKDKALAGNIGTHAAAVKAACGRAEAAGPDIDATIGRYQSIGGR